MSYALRLEDNAVAQLRTLDAGLQEEVLDELDAVAAAAPSRLRVDGSGEAIHDFERHLADVRHIIFIRLHRDDLLHLVTVLAVIDHKRV